MFTLDLGRALSLSLDADLVLVIEMGLGVRLGGVPDDRLSKSLSDNRDCSGEDMFARLLADNQENGDGG